MQSASYQASEILVRPCTCLATTGHRCFEVIQRRFRPSKISARLRALSTRSAARRCLLVCGRFLRACVSCAYRLENELSARLGFALIVTTGLIGERGPLLRLRALTAAFGTRGSAASAAASAISLRLPFFFARKISASFTSVAFVRRVFLIRVLNGTLMVTSSSKCAALVQALVLLSRSSSVGSRDTFQTHG